MDCGQQRAGDADDRVHNTKESNAWNPSYRRRSDRPRHNEMNDITKLMTFKNTEEVREKKNRIQKFVHNNN